MGRTAIQHESAQAAISQHQANAILQEGRAVVASVQQSAQEALPTSEMRIIQEATLALQAEQKKFANAELEMQRGWFTQEQAVRREFQNEFEVERKSLLAKLEGTLTAINKEYAQQMQTEEAIFEKRNRDAISFRNEEFAQKEESLIKSLRIPLLGTSTDSDIEIALLKEEVRKLKEGIWKFESIRQERDAALDQQRKSDALFEEAKEQTEQLQEQLAYERKQRKKWAEEEDEGDVSEPSFRQ